eukprot:2583863-Heterocapsa_arctica.AAC.1
MGQQGGPGDQGGVAELRQGVQERLSRGLSERRQVHRGLALNFRNDRCCTYRGNFNDDRSDQH